MSDENTRQTMMAVERYKFILEKIKFLDQGYSQYFNQTSKVVIAVFTLIAGATLAVMESKISSETLTIAIKAGAFIVSATSIYFALIMCASLSSWFDYRKEEVELLSKIEVDLGREEPSWKGFYRWHEAHFIFALILLAIFNIIVFFQPELITNLLPIE